MKTLLRVRSLTSAVQANVAHPLRLVQFALGAFFILCLSRPAMAADRYWVGGASAAWNATSSWSATSGGSGGASVPTAADDVYFDANGGATSVTVTSISGTVTIRSLTIRDNLDVTLTAGANGTILNLNAGAGNTAFTLEAGSFLTLGSTNTFTFRSLTGANQLWDISGTLSVNAGNTFSPANVNSTQTTLAASGTLNAAGGNVSLFNTTVNGTVNVTGGTMNVNNAATTTFTSTGILNHTAGGVNGSAAGLAFAAGATYNYLAAGALTIPTASWDAASNLNITGITNAATIGGAGQSFGNCTYDCTGQGNVAVTFAATSSTRFKGDFNLVSTGAGTGTVSFKSGTGGVTLNVDGTFNISDGWMNANIGGSAGITLNLNGGYNQTGGTFNLSTANVVNTLNIGGDFVQTAGVFTQTGTSNSNIQFNGTGNYSTAGTVTNTTMNYNVLANGNLTLQNDLVLSNSRTFSVANNGRLNFGTYNISGVTGTTFSVASGGTISIGDQAGIMSSGATGNVQTNTRTFNPGGHYIYEGLTGQTTGTGLPASVTGSITVNLSDGGALTLSNSPASVTIGVNGVLRMVNGSLANTARFVNGVAILEYAGTSPQTTTDNEFPVGFPNAPWSLRINNPQGVTLHAPRTLGSGGALILLDGILNTSGSSLLTLSNTNASGAVSGGSAASYVNGPLARNLNGASSGNVFIYPVGKSVYAPFSFSNGTIGTTTYVGEYFETPPTAAAGSGLSSVGNTYWRLQRTSGAANVLTSTVTLQEANIVADSRIGYSPDDLAPFINKGGTGPAATISSMPMTIGGDAYFTIGTGGALTGNQTAYMTLTSISEALQTMIVTGDVVFELPSSYSGEPGYPVTFYPFNTSGGDWHVTIRPEAGSSGFLTAGDPGVNNTSLIDFDGIDRLTIDGRPGGTGSAVEWIFRHQRTAAGPTFRFINDATENTLIYLQVEGENTNTGTTTAGTIHFGTAAGLSLGNSNNTISYCKIGNRSDNNATPSIGIYSNGTSAALSNSGNQILNNEIYNYYGGTTQSGIYVHTNGSGWTIEGNSFYQTVSRANINNLSHYVINVNNNGTDFVIRGNHIGGTQSGAGGSAYTFTGTASGTMAAIYFNPATGAAGCVIQDNVITNIAWSKGTSTSSVGFVGIRNVNGNTQIDNNTIGATTGTGDITVTENFVTTPSTSNGIYVDAGSCTVENNKIGSVTLAGAATTIGHNFYGIFVSGGSSTLQNNLIGSQTTPNSIHSSTASTNANGQFVIGIQINSTAATTVSGNTIANLSNAYTGTNAANGGIRGIATNATTGLVNISDNAIYNLTAASAGTGTGVTASGIGILFQRTAAGQTISGNTIYGLKNTHASASVHVAGISYGGPTSGVNAVRRNNIHSLSLATSNTAGSITGIHVVTGVATFHNNMIRLGIDEAGNDIVDGYNISGITQASATANNNFYYNSIYIGGNGVSTGSNNTYAYNRTAGTGTINIRNNIFVNERSNGASTGSHYALGFNSLTGLSSPDGSNNNLFHTPGTGGETVLNVSTPQSLNVWQGTGRDVASFAGAVPFVNATGDAGGVDLHLNPGMSNQAESAGFSVAGGPYADFDGETRFGEAGYAGTGTAPDIGADENDFTSLDITPPVINYTPIPDQITLAAPSLSATITDGGGIEVSTGLAPRIYFKRFGDANAFADNTNSTDGWKYVESTTGTSPFAFNIDYGLLFGGTGAVPGDTIQYFVVAQDMATLPNVAINSGDFSAPPAASVALIGNFPITGTVNSYRINILSGTVSVGTGQPYTSLTNDGGLFQAINNGALSGNLVAQITSDLTTETGTHPLNQWNEFGGSGYTLTIQSSAPVLRTISGAHNGAGLTGSGLIRLNGSDRVTFNGGSGTDRFLIFRNTQNGSTFVSALGLYGDATDNTFSNCVFEAGSTGSSNIVGVIYMNSTGGTVGVDNNRIQHCDIRDLTTATGYPRYGIAALGIPAAVNNNNTVENCNIFNFYLNGAGTTGSAGIWVSNYNSNWTITGNNIYQEVTRNTTAASNFEGIRVEGTGVGTAGLSSTGHTITHNKIGGSGRDVSGNITGNWTDNGTVASRFRALAVSQAAGTPSEIHGNVISGFTLSSSSGATSIPGVFAAIYLGGTGSANVGSVEGNTIGDTTGQDKISVTITTAGGVSFGIANAASGATQIAGNRIGGITVSGSAATVSHSFHAINNNSSSATVNISGNRIGSVSTLRSIRSNTATTVTAAGTAQTVLGIYTTSTSGGNVSVTGNRIGNLYVNSSATANTSTAIRGIELSGLGSHVIADNTIYNLESEASNTGTVLSAAVIGILNNQNAGGSPTRLIENNLIYGLQNNCTTATATHMYGILVNATSGSPVNTISRNFIHSFNYPNNTSPSSEEVGIYMAYSGTCSNNMIRLGVLPDGTPSSQPHVTTGILDATTNSCAYHHNTVVITGTAASGNTNTYAFRRTAVSGSKDVRNNIFTNIRTGGTGAHYAFATNTVTGYTVSNFDHNIFHSAANTEFSIASTPAALSGATPALRLQNLRAQTAGGGNNLHSGIGTLAQINFVNTDGNASLVDLRLNNTNCAAGAGTAISSVTTDFDGVITRSNPPAIGAHESASFDTLTTAYDIYTPNFSFTPVPTQTSACIPLPPIVVDVTITDVGVAVETSAGNEPQMWWRVSTGTYAPVAGVLQSGDANNGVWRFTITPSFLPGETYQYYFVADDRAGNRWYSSFNATTPAHPGVTTLTTPAAGPSTFTVNSAVPLSGTVVVGGTIAGGEVAGETWFASLTRFNDLFYNINTRGLSGDLLVLVRENVTNEDGNQVLNQWQEYCGSGYRLTIRPETPSLKTLSGSLLGMGLFSISGADRVTIDGRFNGTGTDRYLRFANTYSGSGGSENDAIKIGGFGTSRDITVRYCDIESQSAKVAGATVYIASGSDSVTLENNLIHGGSAWATNVILADGAANVTIKDNEIYNFLSWGAASRAYGIRVNSGNGSNWTITGNSIYNTGINGQSTQTALSFAPGAASTDNVISGNYIGGGSAQCGTGGIGYWGNSWDNFFSGENQVQGIVVNAGHVTLDQNTIQNIRVTNSDYSGFVGIYIQGTTAATITNNTIGNSTSSASVTVSGGGLVGGYAPGYVYGVWHQSTGNLTLEDNNFYYLHQSGAYTGGQSVPVFVDRAANFSIRNNHLQGNQSAGISYNSFGIRISPSSGTANGTIEGNVIDGPYINTNSGSYFPLNAGIYTTGSVNATISKNRILDMRSAYVSGYSLGIYLAGSGNFLVHNNYISLCNVNNTIRISLYGIADELSSGSIKCYNNSVVISGSQAAGGSFDNSSYAFYRSPAGSGSVVDLKNNIFINSRTGGNTLSFHVGVGNYGVGTTDPSWGNNASNYNLVCVSPNTDRGRFGVWGLGAYNQFTNWQSAGSGNDANSWAVFTTNGAGSATALNPADLFNDVLLADLSIKTNHEAAWFANGKGIAGPVSGNMTDDFDGNARDTTYGLGIDLGAQEFTPNVLPHALTATPVPNSTNTFTFAGRTIGSITWGSGGTVPSSVTARYFSGDEPGTSPSPAYGGTDKADFMVEFTPTGGSGYTYTATLNYDDALLGSFVNAESSMKMIKTASSSWLDVTSNIDTINNLLTNSSALGTFSYFSGGSTMTPLPIELLSFDANCQGDHVKINWSTATEINNEEFTVHRSADLVSWEEILSRPGAGNSNQIRHYAAVDERPLSGPAYYRLSQRDYDGTTETFAPVSVNCQNDGAGNAMSVYPNPATDHFKVAITMAAPMDGVVVEIVDINGKKVAERNVNLTEGTTELSFDTQQMKAGTYVVRLVSDTVSIRPVKLVIK